MLSNIPKGFNEDGIYTAGLPGGQLGDPDYENRDEYDEREEQ